MTSKVYLIKTDTREVGMCGHEISIGEEYYMVRTSVPKMVILCKECVALLNTPTRVSMKDLVHAFDWKRVPSEKEKRKKIIKEVVKKREAKSKEELGKAEWI